VSFGQTWRTTGFPCNYHGTGRARHRLPGQGACKTVCRQTLADGWTVDYDEGTEITVSSPDGKTTRKFKCVKGQWVQEMGTVATTILAPTVTCPAGTRNLRGPGEPAPTPPYSTGTFPASIETVALRPMGGSMSSNDADV
jgi:hypothetical protein